MTFGTEILTPCIHTFINVNISIGVFYEIKILDFKPATQYFFLFLLISNRSTMYSIS